MDGAGDEGLKSNEKVYPESEVKKLKARIAELERALGRKTGVGPSNRTTGLT